ncbi:SixA phosphatase family protein [Xanthovirga aplysinae]|uniref:SixA phosphatase family protein n=1 Tax=Xanthovirga aplysinae TaxID=2529853 RepID=UPI0012BCD45C|nr:histidine phosphatase family protein [Xanthovirga aplysinae]MTI29835.1 hypothetical protein [Xanthovirga aplysinae]
MEKKELYLLRHAAAQEGIYKQQDLNRDLSQEGLNQLTILAKKLQLMDFHPDFILASNAKRCRDTASFLVENLGLSKATFLIKEEIYEASSSQLLQLVNLIPENHQKVLLVGHNPSISSLAEYITGDSFGVFPTSTLVKITFEVEFWAEISGGTGYLLSYVQPL